MVLVNQKQALKGRVSRPFFIVSKLYKNAEKGCRGFPCPSESTIDQGRNAPGHMVLLCGAN